MKYRIKVYFGRREWLVCEYEDSGPAKNQALLFRNYGALGLKWYLYEGKKCIDSHLKEPEYSNLRTEK